mmetsp:Transcript_31220/g.69446  ORF Transcript_31220/g.69446 Transcript_31220/m.69446 type:complete len:482 (+) Transcript_31220:82-1527(+)|eukprot:CAMPEP_0202905996 /NCGR_PEP_ID=MMETSP1392-20130828/36945_1 /ASSEMBLY_ACC=CAM_ASM_000868 /TAXON_ID=225041 /ORGANISM="Chlamydomonas chlamydogama, Strain SAG 11-48b" /LENGTH=481 /DNA_ID=CAMNT_0049594327 /DNA_START=78 /DNA_END=1523 /DNA_ORIENTATION=-
MGCGASSAVHNDSTPFLKASKSRDLQDCGVSLAFLEDFVRKVAATSSTADVVTSCIIPGTQERCCRYVDIIPQQHVGSARFFVSHCWAGLFHHLVLQLQQYLDPSVSKAYQDKNAIYVWIDIFAVNQHIGRGSTQADDLANLQTVITRVERTLLILDSTGVVLTRIWCLYEIWQTMKKHTGVLEVLAEVSLLDLEQVQGVIKQLDIKKAKATRDQDRVRILAQIDRSLGHHKLRSMIKSAVVASAIAAEKRALAVLGPSVASGPSITPAPSLLPGPRPGPAPAPSVALPPMHISKSAPDLMAQSAMSIMNVFRGRGAPSEAASSLTPPQPSPQGSPYVATTKLKPLQSGPVRSSPAVLVQPEARSRPSTVDASQGGSTRGPGRQVLSVLAARPNTAPTITAVAGTAEAAGPAGLPPAAIKWAQRAELLFELALKMTEVVCYEREHSLVLEDRAKAKGSAAQQKQKQTSKQAQKNRAKGKGV